MRVNAGQLVSAIGAIAWGVLLIFASRGRVWLLNVRWEGRQDDMRRIAARATLVVGVASVAFGVWQAFASVV